ADMQDTYTYIDEETPEKKRDAHVGISQLAWSIGPMVTFVLAVILAPLGLLGSRIIFLHLLIIALVPWYIRRGLPESKLWEEDQAKQKPGKIKKSTIKELFSLKVTRGALFLLIGIYWFWNLTSGAMGYYMPYIYENVGWLNAGHANLVQAVL